MSLYSLLCSGHPFLQVFNSFCCVLILIALRLWVELSLHLLIYHSSQRLKRLDSLPVITFYLLYLPLYLLYLLSQQPVPQLLLLPPLALIFTLIALDSLLQGSNPSQDIVDA